MMLEKHPKGILVLMDVSCLAAEIVKHRLPIVVSEPWMFRCRVNACLVLAKGISSSFMQRCNKYKPFNLA